MLWSRCDADTIKDFKNCLKNVGIDLGDQVQQYITVFKGLLKKILSQTLWFIHCLCHHLHIVLTHNLAQVSQTPLKYIKSQLSAQLAFATAVSTASRFFIGWIYQLPHTPRTTHFQFTGVLFLDQFPTNADEPNLHYYLTQIWGGWIHSFPKGNTVEQGQ